MKKLSKSGAYNRGSYKHLYDTIVTKTIAAVFTNFLQSLYANDNFPTLVKKKNILIF